jgi:hypothetical protein
MTNSQLVVSLVCVSRVLVIGLVCVSLDLVASFVCFSLELVVGLVSIRASAVYLSFAFWSAIIVF